MIRNNQSRFVLLMVVLLLGMSARAEQKIIDNTVLDKHYGWLSLGGGYFTLLEQFDDITTQGGGQVSLSGGYELRYGMFYFSAGVDFAFWLSNATTQAWRFDRAMYDTQGKLMTYHYDLDPSREHSFGLTARIPLMIGMTVNGFYFGVGANVGYQILSENHATRAYRGCATYDQYFEDFTNMPNHFYTNYVATKTEHLRMNIPVNLIGEIGYDVLANYSYSSYSRDQVLKIGAYVEYGLTNAFSNEEDGSLFDPNPEHPIQLDIWSYYTKKATTTHRVVPLSVGIKLTWMLRIPTKNCNCKPF